MRALVVYCHPSPQSYTAAVLKVVCSELERCQADIQVLDLYDLEFDPVLGRQDWETIEDQSRNTLKLKEHTNALKWCDTLIFIYPTWWYGQPALLKGWLDRVLVPGVAFSMPQANGDIQPGLQNIKRLGVFTTCGASWWLTRVIGTPGRRIILRGIRLLCHRRAKTLFCAHYLMDSSTPRTREKHLFKVKKQLQKLIGRR